MTGRPRGVRAALAVLAVLAVAATTVSFGESYRGLLLWAVGHELGGWPGWLWPLQVDTFIALGELDVFLSLRLRWDRRSRIAGWVTTAAGLLVSVAANVGHISGPDVWLDRLTAAVPPIAAFAALTFAFSVLRRLTPAPARAAAVVPARRRKSAERTRRLIAAADTGQPTSDLARRMKVSARTVRRYRPRPAGGEQAG